MHENNKEKKMEIYLNYTMIYMHIMSIQLLHIYTLKWKEKKKKKKFMEMNKTNRLQMTYTCNSKGKIIAVVSTLNIDI